MILETIDNIQTLGIFIKKRHPISKKIRVPLVRIYLRHILKTGAIPVNSGKWQVGPTATFAQLIHEKESPNL